MLQNSKKSIIYLFLFLALFILLFNNNNCHLSGTFSTINTVFSLVITCIIIFYYIINGKYSKICVCFLLYLAFELLSCYLGKYSNVKNLVTIYYPIIGVFLLLDIMLQKNPKFTILSLEKIFFLLILINFITLIIFPNGLYSDVVYSNNWFLLYDNIHIFIYMPGLLVSEIASNYKKTKLNIIYIIMFLLVSYSVLYCFSATSVVAYLLYVVYIVFKNRINKLKIMNAITYFIVFLFIFFFIVVLRFQNVFEPLIVDYLHKDLTFTGRTYIWDQVTQYIKEKPVLGYGIENSKIFARKIGGETFAHAHNTVYDILYKGGIVSLLAFMSIVICTIRKLYKNRDNSIAKLTAFVLFTIFVMINFEARQDKIGFYIILIVGYHIESIIESLKLKDSKQKQEGS